MRTSLALAGLLVVGSAAAWLRLIRRERPVRLRSRPDPRRRAVAERRRRGRPRSLRILRRVSLPGCENDHGLSVDAQRRLAFVACDHNATLLTLDLTRMKVTGRATVGDEPDVLAFDSSLRRLYVASESGVIAVFSERGRALRKLAQAFLASNAHAVAVDSK